MSTVYNHTLLAAAVVACQGLKERQRISESDYSAIVVVFSGMGWAFVAALGTVLEKKGWAGACQRFRDEADTYVAPKKTFGEALEWTRETIRLQDEDTTGRLLESFEETEFYAAHGRLWDYLSLALTINFEESLSAGQALDFLLTAYRGNFQFWAGWFSGKQTSASLNVASKLLMAKASANTDLREYLMDCGLVEVPKPKTSHLRLV